jgi:hypothetical protein
LIIALSGGLLILALSALSRNSRYVALMWVGICFVSSVTSTILMGVHEQQRRFAYYQQMNSLNAESRRERMNVPPQQGLQDFQKELARRRALAASYQADLRKIEINDWRPLVSYTSNLARLGNALLGTDQTWRRLYQELYPEDTEGQFVSFYLGPQYPWYWSAEVLVVLSGLSACILKLSVKSLDRLR